MVSGNLRVFLVVLVVQVCLLLAMTASAAQAARRGLGAVNLEATTDVCCPYHPDCCRANAAGGGAKP
ncbi:unnamed protein product [Urochloa decumbens]|uniref:Uncharacterized protein n=1 Tax=Urochloa decumbens TaxID=240449 RepID=A0ABC8ZIY2_9POAL